MMNEHALCAFAEVIGEGDQTALLFDHRGVVRAGMYLDNRCNDVSGEIGAALAGVGVEATRAMRHLGIGEWRAIVCECVDANLAMAPADDGDIVLVAAAPSVPSGFVRRLLDLASRRALAWRREVA
jgi:predicted regulator of Ras-like GTPase activity (Roadblock/LC7/MglB family)